MMLTGLKRSTIYLWASEGRFPRQFKIGNSRASGWAGDEVAAWIESRVQEGLARRDSESAEAA
jgi:prophage regulatory protein